LTTAINDLPEQMVKWRIEEWIRDYKFMLREIARLNKILDKPEFPKQKLTAAYGYEAMMPRGSRGISQAELKQLDHREKRLYKYLAIVEYLDRAVNDLEGDKEKVIFDCMLEGVSYTQIAVHLACSRDTIRKIKEGIIAKIAMKVKKDKFLQKLRLIDK